jgi:hypothetical protein
VSKLSQQNQYNVIMYFKGFHEVQAGQRFTDCEFGFNKVNQYFLSSKVSANSSKEAKIKGARRLNQVLSIFVLYSGMIYDVSTIHVFQIAGEEPFLHMAPLMLERTVYLPVSKEKSEKIENWITIFDGLSAEDYSTKRADKSVNYFSKGCYLESRWRSESFLNFFKVIELISQDFVDDFRKELKNQLSNTLLSNITEEEISELQKQKRIVKFACNKLGIKDFNTSKIVELSHKFGAHTSIEEAIVSRG